MKAKTKKDPFGLALLWVGALFLVNPLINIVDILPDAVGYILMALALGKISAMNSFFKSARRGFLILCAVSAVKLFFVAGLGTSSDSYKLLMTFSFAVVETIFFLPAVSNLFEGFSWLGTRCGAGGTDAVRVSKNKTRPVSLVRRMTYAAFFVRAAGSVLPVLPAVTMTGVTYFPGAHTADWTLLTPLLYVVSWIAGLSVGAVWTVLFVRYVRGVTGSSTQALGLLYGRYENEYLADAPARAADRMRLASYLLIIAAPFTLNMYVDGVNIFPDAICAVLFLSVFVLLRRDGGKLCPAGIAASAVWAAVSLFGEYLQIAFRAENYKPKSAALGIGKAPHMYLIIEISAFIETAAFAVCVLLMLFVLKRALMSHAKLIGGTAENTSVKLLYLPASFWFVSALSAAALTVLLKYFPQYWLVNGLISAALTVVSVLTAGAFKERIYARAALRGAITERNQK